MKILLTGATGYVGGKLLRELVSFGHEVRCMVRDRSRVRPGIVAGATLVEADALRAESLAPALESIDVAYYLIHSMGGNQTEFEERDRQAAANFASAAKKAGVRRIIYLGGLASQTTAISAHLKSRQETGAVLREYGPPVTEFRAGIIVGNGSVSFEMIRSLTERLPVMICPRWVITRTQPIAISDVLQYLVAALSVPASNGQIIEIGGATVESYRSMMLTYAKARGLRRWLLRVPVLTPKLSSYWLRLVTPIPAAIARPLIEGLRTEVVCTSPLAEELFPGIQPISYAAAVETVLSRPVPDETLQEAVPDESGHVSVRREGLICDIRQTLVNAPAERVFAVVSSLGGDTGWLYTNLLWRLRGAIDTLLGGVGMRRGGIRKAQLEVGDCIDFWRVDNVEPPRHLLLRAEMKVPGRAWLQFELRPQPADQTLLRCSAWFEPSGLAGEFYWWGLYPIHILIFAGMVKAIQKRSEQSAPSLRLAFRGR
jgi:uncharacterized protein YbjT (DUF2867 family)